MSNRFMLHEVYGEATTAAIGEVTLPCLTAVGVPVKGLEGRTGKVTLLFIDLCPPANWGHECLYIISQPGHPTIVIEETMPPVDAIELTPLVIVPDPYPPELRRIKPPCPTCGVPLCMSCKSRAAIEADRTPDPDPKAAP